MAKSRDPDTAPGEDSLHGDSADAMDAKRAAEQEESAEDNYDQHWLDIARNAFSDSESYVETSLRAQWERNERAFQNRHASGSKYLSDQYKGRSRLYRPKTRTNIRQAEAALAMSMFANENVVEISPANEDDPRQKASADITREILQYRLTMPNRKIGVPWFLTCIGAYQNAQKYGIVASKQWWEYRVRKDPVLVPVTDENDQPVTDEEGRAVLSEDTEETVIFDRPRIDLIAPENIRIDRSADWIDPINSSPFVILLYPMYIHEIESRMTGEDSKTGAPPWRELTRTELKAAGKQQSWDSTRQQREGNREDPKESEIAIDEFSIVWVHENFITWEGREWVYYTAGTQYLLSDPAPLEEVYPHCEDGIRPITMGSAIIETHKTYPAGKPQLVEDLQREANELVNLRLDNVKLALNKRYKAVRGKNVDLRSLLRNVPGSVTLMNSLDDVDVIETRDVTSSSYQEQDRINADFDDIAGGFSPGSVQTNRRMNETVGGMELLSGSGNMLQELDLRTFVETWAEATLNMVVTMIQRYENDVTIVTLAGQKAELFQRYGINRITDDMLRQHLTTKVNVGIGATDPERRLNRFVTGLKAATELLGPAIMTSMNIEAVVAEIFGALGYRDGKRFFRFGKQDPMVMMLMQQMKELQKQLDRKELDNETKVKVAEIAGMAKIISTRDEDANKLDVERLRNEGAETIEAMRAMSKQAETRHRGNTEREIARTEAASSFEQEVLKGIFGAEQRRQQNAAQNG